MRNLLLLTLIFNSLNLLGQSFFDRSDTFFSKYVKEGKVNYALIKNDPTLLQGLVTEIAAHDLSNKRVTPEYLKAFYINVYNILVIKQVVDRYPIDGPLKVDGFFNKIEHSVMGEKMTLDELEKDQLYKRFPDPRLHFVLVCAARGCPPLVPYSYRPEVLEKQLTSRTREVLNLEWFIRVNKKVEVSQIFEWYQTDFVKDAGSVSTFINKYRNKRLPENVKISYYTYNWQLNDM